MPHQWCHEIAECVVEGTLTLAAARAEPDGGLASPIAICLVGLRLSQTLVPIEVESERHVVWVEAEGHQTMRGEVLLLICLDEDPGLDVQEVAWKDRRFLRGLFRLDATEGLEDRVEYRQPTGAACSGRPKCPRWLIHGTRARTRTIPSAAAAAWKAFSQSPLAMVSSLLRRVRSAGDDQQEPPLAPDAALPIHRSRWRSVERQRQTDHAAITVRESLLIECSLNNDRLPGCPR